jgi:S-adenosylmethionine:tRNA ribosyltransferase-isomerase
MNLQQGNLDIQITATHLGTQATSQIVELSWSVTGEDITNDNGRVNTLPTFAEVLESAGQLPIPPYLNRDTQPSDLTTYQTVYSKIKGSVAAPTAGLHFTPEVLQSLAQHHIDEEELTLHVGAGTFKPVKSKEMGGHEMHTEHIFVRRQTLEKLLSHQCEAIAVGTTSVRTLESLYYMGLKVMGSPELKESELHVSQWEPYELPAFTQHPQREQVIEAIRSLLSWLDANHLNALHASTQIIIAPGYEFKIVKQLITNFHQPQSTLLLLVSAFTKGQWRIIYEHALANGYRFLSYGDSSLLKV